MVFEKMLLLLPSKRISQKKIRATIHSDTFLILYYTKCINETREKNIAIYFFLDKKYYM